MLGSVRLFVDRQRAAHQRLGLRQTVRVLEQLRQVVQRDGDAGVLGSVRLFVNGQRAAHQRFGLRQTVRGLEQLRQVVQVCGDPGVPGSVRLLVDGQRAAHQRLGLRQMVRGLEQQRQFAHGPGTQVTPIRACRFVQCVPQFSLRLNPTSQGSKLNADPDPCLDAIPRVRQQVQVLSQECYLRFRP